VKRRLHQSLVELTLEGTVDSVQLIEAARGAMGRARSSASMEDGQRGLTPERYASYLRAVHVTAADVIGLPLRHLIDARAYWRARLAGRLSTNEEVNRACVELILIARLFAIPEGTEAWSGRTNRRQSRHQE
jgi:hypothetical protein